MPKRKFPHFAELDSVRGLAALVVFVHHFFQFERISSPPNLVLNWIAKASTLGYLGVDVFFVLSGFLITSLLFVSRREQFLFHNFYWKRVLRIWPVLLVHLGLFAILVPHGWKYVLLSLVFLQNFSNRLAPGIAGPTWTLSIEEQFYLFWPLAVTRFRVRTISVIALLLAALSITLRVMVPLLHHGAFAQEHTWYRLDGLGLGALLACQWFAPEDIGTSLFRIIRLFRSRIALLVAFAVTLAVMRCDRQLGMIAVGLRSTVTCFITYRIIARIVLDRTPHGFAWLGAPLLRWFGAISYGLYMYHGFVLDLMVRAFGLGNNQSSSVVLLRFAGALSVSLFVSTLSMVALERPIQRLRPIVLREEPRPVAT